MSEIAISVLLLSLVILLTYQIRIDSHTREKLFEVQIEMGKGQAAMTKELPWSELKKLIDEIINFTVNNYIITNGVSKMTDEELAINWTYMIEEISADVEISLSDEMKRQILKSISQDYMSRYIAHSVQLVMVYRLQSNKPNRVGDKLQEIQQNIADNNKK